MAAETIGDLSARYGDSYRLLLTSAGMIAAFTMVFTGTIVNVAVPDVMGAYGVGQDTAQLLSTGYVAAMTASQQLRLEPRHTLAIVRPRNRAACGRGWQDGQVPCPGHDFRLRPGSRSLGAPLRKGGRVV